MLIRYSFLVLALYVAGSWQVPAWKAGDEYLLEGMTDEKEKALERTNWYKSRILYQVYPRSFKDSTGRGQGDLNGIKSKLDHFESLGKKQVSYWISPFFTSPMADFGYDISNFTDVDPQFGNMDDFKALAEESRKKGIPLLLDFVPNHTSDNCTWFQMSRERILPYDDYYIWADSKDNSTSVPPTNWLSVYNGRAWTFDEKRGQWYFHQFLDRQPDLNYRNPKVVEEMKNVIRFWLDIPGVMGFRVDAITDLFETKELKDEERSFNPKITNATWYDYLNHNYTSNLLPEIFGVMAGWRRVLDEYEKNDGWKRVMYAEIYDRHEVVTQYYGTKDKPIAEFPFNFNFIDLNNQSTAVTVYEMANDWLSHLPEWVTPNWVIGNHDRHRAGSRIGSTLRINALHTFTLLQGGPAITYYGEEIGMVNHNKLQISDLRDPWGLIQGSDLDKMKFTRDYERTPMQWTSGPTAGFSTNNGAKLWLPLHENYKQGINVEDETKIENSHLSYYRKLMELRYKYTRTMYSHNTWPWIYMDEDVLSFARIDPNQPDKSIIVVINWSLDTVTRNISSQKDRWGKKLVLPSDGTVLLFNNQRGNAPAPKDNDVIYLDNIELHGGETIVLFIGTNPNKTTKIILNTTPRSTPDSDTTLGTQPIPITSPTPNSSSNMKLSVDLYPDSMHLKLDAYFNKNKK